MSESVITSEIRYRRLFETAKDGILILDAETGMIEDVNPFLTGLLGYPYDSFIDKAVWELGFFKDIMANKEKFSELQQKEYVRYDDLPLETAQGKQINVEFVSNVYLEGKRKVIQCNIRDITKRRQMENLVLQTQKNYNTFFNTIDDFLFVLDIQGNIIQTNSTVTNRLGYSTDELTGKSVLFVHPPEMREEASDMVKDMLAGKTSVCLVPVMTKAGMRIPVETRVSRGVWDGRPVIFGVTKDISKIRLSEEKFSKLFHINPSACGLSDLDDFKYIEVNKAFCALLGFSQAEVIGKTAMELAIFSESERTSVLLNADPSGNVINVEARLKSKTGEIKHVLLSSENIYIQDKKYRFTVVNDITARKLAEVELADSKSRLELAMHAGNMAWWEMEKSTGNITFAKKKAEMLGYPPERFTHYTDFMELVHPEDVKKTMKAMQNHFDGLIDNYESEYRVLDQSGKYQWFHDIGSIVKRDPEGKPLLISGLVLNTTERKQTEIALHNNEVRLRTLVQTIPDLVWLKDTDGVYQSCNKMFERFFGATEANIIGKTDYDFVSSEQADWFRSHDYAAMTAKKPISNEEWISYADDGTRVYLDTIKTPMYDSEGVVIGVLGISHDITKRKKSEVDLLESEEKFKSIYEGSYDAIMLMNHTGFFDCNPRTLEMFGLKNKADFIGLHPSELSPPVQQDGRFSLLSAEEKITVAYQQGMNQFDWVHLRANGEEFPVKVTLSTFNLKEKPVIQATIRDLSTTEQQLIIANSALIFQNEEKENRAAELKIANTELAFQNEEKENRAAELKIANTELAFQNEEKENRAAELKIANTELAFQNDEKENRAAELRVANTELAFQNEEKENRAAELRVANTELAFQNDEKENRAAELKIANTELAFQNEEKENRAAELRIANTELAFQNEEKEKRAVELGIAKEKAEESDKLKTAFLQNMSHEIRTPLNGIIGFSALLNEENLSRDEIKDFTAMISQSGKRLIEIVNNVLDISKIQTGQIKITMTHLSVNSMFLDLHTFFLPLAQVKQIKLNYHNQENKFRTIYSDESKLHQVLTNLINNAIKFTKSGSIDFGFEITGHTITFYVKDTGIGIPPELHFRIFDRFIQAEQSLTKNYEGAGLGLAISKGLVELLGGRIWVESEKNKGTTFFFSLPNTINAAPVTPAKNRPEVHKKSIRGKILVAEDDWISFKYLSNLLLKSGATVIHAENGAVAVELVKNTQDISLILMDIKMPVMNGIEATKLIKLIRPDIPIIAQTAYAFTEEKNIILSTGCNEYLVKPIEPARLKGIINKYLKNTDGQ